MPSGISSAPSRPLGAIKRGQGDAGDRRRQGDGMSISESARPSARESIAPGPRRPAGRMARSPGPPARRAQSSGATTRARRGSVTEMPRRRQAQVPRRAVSMPPGQQHDKRQPQARDAKGQGEPGNAETGNADAHPSDHFPRRENSVEHAAVGEIRRLRGFPSAELSDGHQPERGISFARISPRPPRRAADSSSSR